MLKEMAREVMKEYEAVLQSRVDVEGFDDPIWIEAWDRIGALEEIIFSDWNIDYCEI